MSLYSIDISAFGVYHLTATVERLFNHSTNKEKTMSEISVTSQCCCETPDSEKVQQTKNFLPSDTLLYDCADFFKMFADSTRMKILWTLDRGEICVCDIAEVLGMTKSAVSHQLNTLRREKLVKCRKSGKNILYSLDDDHVKDILEKGMDHVLEITGGVHEQ